MSFQVLIVLGVFSVIIVRRFSPVAGSIVAMTVALILGAVGYASYAQGGVVGFGVEGASVQMTRPVFMSLIGVWFGLETWGLVRALKRRTQKEPEDDSLDVE